MKYDIIVVGGGPAGAIAAKVAAESGLSTLLLEKMEFTREKPCGGLVQGMAFDRFDFPSSVNETFERNCYGAFVCAPSGNNVTCFAGEPVGQFVWRSRFDPALVFWAENKGAEVREKTRVTDLTMKAGYVKGVIAKSKQGTEDIEAEIVIGADGYYSFIARRLGLLVKNMERVSAQFTYQMEMPESEIDEKIEDAIEIYYGTELSPANMWICPKREGLSLGIGSILTEITEEKTTLKERLDYFRKKHPIASEKLKNAKVILEQPSQIFFPGTMRRAYYNGALLAGESAGQVVMATGAGIYWSMVGGDLAAKTAVDAIEKEDVSEKFLKNYEERVNEEIGNDLELGVKLRTKAADIASRERVLENLKADKAARDRFALMVAGKHPLTEIARFW